MPSDTDILYQGPRLRIRPFRSGDVQPLITMHRDPRVRAHLADDVPLDEPRIAHNFIAHMQQFYRQYPGTGIWCAEHIQPRDPDTLADARRAHAEGEIDDALLAMLGRPRWAFCGWFSLVHLADDPQTLEIGARLSPQAWGGALALDGGEWLLQHAFGPLRQRQVLGHCASTNRSAAHCLQVLGFCPQGLVAYNGTQAQRFGIDHDQWARWHAQPRRQRQRAVLGAPVLPTCSSGQGPG